jgi:SAM-dependent methyltransferase
MGYKAACARFYRSSARRLAPRLRYSQISYEEALAGLVRPGVRWLDLGCGHQVLPPWRGAEEARLVGNAGLVVGVDRDDDAMRKHRSIRRLVGADIGRLPFAPASFDLVTANMVVEHLDCPERQFAEIARVLAPGGAFLFHTGNVYGYYILISRLMPEGWKRGLAQLLQDRASEDVYPTHYRANSRARIRALARAAGLEVQSVGAIPSSPQTELLPPAMLLELLWIRLTMTRPLAGLRTNLIVALRKPAVEAT